MKRSSNNTNEGQGSSSSGAPEGKKAKKTATKPQKFTRDEGATDEDLIILKYIEDHKSIPELCKLLPERGPTSVRWRFKLLMDRLKSTAGQ